MIRSVQSTLVLAAFLGASTHAEVPPSPYAGEQAADVKALTAEEQAALLEGKGMGFAKAAELNGYPGPAHVLELATQLELTAAQLAQTRQLFERMQATARADGARLIDAERQLDRLYTAHVASPGKVTRQVARIESIRARLRALHLNAHLEQAALLTPAQIARYSQLRGYGGTLASPHRHTM